MKTNLAAVVATAVVALGAWWVRDATADEPAKATPAVAVPVTEPTPAAAPAPLVAPPVPIASPPPPVLAARALASAQTTVQSQVSLLEDGQYDLFVQTFAEALRPLVTREAFEACRVRIRQVPVKPDWEVAEESTHDGRRVLAVSMFGKSMTAFEETDGRWLAGSVWCVPVGLP